MTSQFAAECLLLTSQLPDYLMGRRKLAVPIAQRARYVVNAVDASAADGLSHEGTTKELSNWLRQHLVSYEPRGERWRISLDEAEACVVVANPRITLNCQGAAAPGAAAKAPATPVDILVSCVWTGHVGAAQLQHVHISGIGLATRASSPNGLVAPGLLDAALPADPELLAAEGGLALGGLPVLQSASASAPPKHSVDLQLVLRGSEDVLHTVQLDQLLYLAAERNYSRLVGTQETVRVRGALSRLMEWMPGFVVRVHRSYAVNALAVREMHGGNFVLCDGQVIRVPNRKRTEMRAAVLRAQSEYADLPRPAV